MPRTELNMLKGEIRAYNKVVQQVIKERIVQNRETRQMKIKLKDEAKQPYTLEQLRDISNKNKYFLLFKQNGDKLFDIIKEEQGIYKAKKMEKLARKQIVQQDKLKGLEIIPNVDFSTKQMLSDTKIRAMYRKAKHPEMPWSIKGKYPGYEEFYNKWNLKYGKMVNRVKSSDKYSKSSEEDQKKMFDMAYEEFFRELAKDLENKN